MGIAFRIGLGIVVGLFAAKKVAEYIDKHHHVPLSDEAMDTLEELTRLRNRWAALTPSEQDAAIGYIERMDKPTIH